MTNSNFCIVMSTLTLIWLDARTAPHSPLSHWFAILLAIVGAGWIVLAVLFMRANASNESLDAELKRLRARKAELEKEWKELNNK